MPTDGVIEQRRKQPRLADGGRILKRAHADMARRHAGEHCPGQRRLPPDPFTRGGHRKTPRGRDPQRVHRLADDVFPQHWALRGAAIAAARVSCPAPALEMQIDATAVRREMLAEEDRPTVAEIREVAELVAGIGLGDRIGPGRKLVADEHGCACGPKDPGIDPEISRQPLVERQDRRRLNGYGRGPVEQQLRQPGIRVVEPPTGIADQGHDGSRVHPGEQPVNETFSS